MHDYVSLITIYFKNMKVIAPKIHFWPFHLIIECSEWSEGLENTDVSFLLRS